MRTKQTPEEFKQARREASRRWKENHSDYDAAYYQKNKEQHQNQRLRSIYGITLAIYERMFAAQGGKCAICNNSEVRTHSKTKQVMRLSVDHCHSSGKIRGLLCHRCNLFVGFLEEGDYYIEATHYIQAYSEVAS